MHVPGIVYPPIRMGTLRTVALVILGISAFVFIALFGRLPLFRKTPVAFLHRALWIYIPNGISFIDSRLLGGRVVWLWKRSGSYVLSENHPLVLIFFLSLLLIGEYIFLPPAWPRISSSHKPWVLAVVIVPYVLLYKSVVTKSFITSQNHEEEMKRYPYDRALFHPGNHCSTCHFLKPARSKHCSICRACVSRHDHHCVWLMNCVGAQNYPYFLSLLLSLSVLLIYGSILGYSLLCQTLEQYVSLDVREEMRESWITYLNVWTSVITLDPKIGAVFLLMLMTAPLAVAFLVYHTYLVWAGMTTNETSKWSDWKEDVLDGFVYKANRNDVFGLSSSSDWPVHSDQILVTGDEPPRGEYVLATTSNRIAHQGRPDAPVDVRWRRLRSMRDVDNIYDMGFWLNLRDTMGFPVR